MVGIQRLQNVMFSTVTAVLIIYTIAVIIGFSGAIAVLSIGFILTNQASIGFQRIGIFHNLSFAVISETERNFYTEFFFIKNLFFIFPGLSIQFHSIISFLVSVMGVFVIYVRRLIVCQVMVLRTTFRREVSILFVMVPKGPAAAVLAGIPLQKNLAGAESIQNTVYGIVLISIILTTVLIPIINYTPIKNFYNRFFNSFHPDHFPESTDTSA